MEEKRDTMVDFFTQLWSFATQKHHQGVYNTVCLVVLLALPLLVILTALVVCCHCCCCRHGNRCCCCCRGDSAAVTRSETMKKKKKKKEGNADDLWISVKMTPLTPDRAGLAAV